MGKQYVQHISGQGAKWEIDDCVHVLDVWNIKGKSWIRLPKVEYRLCEPPEEWEDVTEQCCVKTYHDSSGERMFSISDTRTGRNAMHVYNNYRVCKINLTYESCNHTHAFIVERRKS